MTDKLVFSRSPGGFKLSEDALAPQVALMREGDGLNTKLPGELVDAAATEIVNAAHRIRLSAPHVSFEDASRQIMRERPALAFISRSDKTRTGGIATIEDVA